MRSFHVRLCQSGSGSGEVKSGPSGAMSKSDEPSLLIGMTYPFSGHGLGDDVRNRTDQAKPSVHLVPLPRSRESSRSVEAPFSTRDQ